MRIALTLSAYCQQPSVEVAATIKHDCYCHQLILFVPSGNATHGLYQKTAPVRPVVAARPAEYVCSEDLFY